MNPIHRLVINVQAKFDQLVSQMENHQALAAVAVQELEGALRDARAQYRRLQLQCAKLAERVSSLRQEAEQWADRARKVHAEAPKDALECVRRMKQAQTQAAALAEHQLAQERLERELSLKLTRTEERLVELSQKRSALVAREASVTASEAVARIDGQGGAGVADSIFERWETELAGREPLEMQDSDLFAKQFEDQEREEELRKTLDALVAEKPA